MVTSVQPRVVDMTDVEPEFQKPCDECDHAAEWAALSSHAKHECPHFGYVCTQHKQQVDELWGEILSTPYAGCTRCNIFLSGLVSDNLKWVKL